MDKAMFEAGLKNRREVFLQIAIYCGVPATIDAFRNAREVFKELGI